MPQAELSAVGGMEDLFYDLGDFWTFWQTVT